MQFFTYWQNPEGSSVIPPYILLGLVSMRAALGNKFRIVTRRSAADYVPQELIDRPWSFGLKSAHLSTEIMDIVAFSDFIRLYIVHHHGGFWVDADTIAMNDFSDRLERMSVDGKLLYHSQQFFGAAAGHPIPKRAADNLINVTGPMQWGYVGDFDKMVAEEPGIIAKIPLTNMDCGHRPMYRAVEFDVMFRKDIEPSEFLTNPEQMILKMYNSQFVKFVPAEQPVEDFLESGILLSKIFLHLNSDRTFWADESARVKDYLIEGSRISG